MEIPHKISDWVLDTYDFAVVENNRIEWLSWRDPNASLEQTSNQIWHALRVATRIWSPAALPVRLSPFIEGIPDPAVSEEMIESLPRSDDERLLVAYEQRVQEARLAKQQQDPSRTWGISSIGPALQGRLRLAIPAGVDVESPWRIATADGYLSQKCEVQKAPPFDHSQSVWISLGDSSLCSDISLFVSSIGDVELRLTLGLTAFNPRHELRPIATFVRGASLADWQSANERLLQEILDELHRAGWVAGRTP